MRKLTNNLVSDKATELEDFKKFLESTKCRIAFSSKFKLQYLKTETYHELLSHALENNQDSLLYTLASFFVKNYPEDVENKRTQSMISHDFRFTKVIFNRFRALIVGETFYSFLLTISVR